MSYVIEKIVPRANLVKDKLPLSEELQKQVEEDRKELFEIFKGKDKRKILIVGPCSAWPDTAVIDYAKKIKEVSDKVKDKIKIILRVYTQKPRTTIGWTGPINQPDPFKDPDLEEGIIYCRKMMIKILEIGLPIADEALFTHNEGYFSDLLSWIAIGARSSEDQEHRVFASMIDSPVGLKNPTSGNLQIAANSVLSAQNPHVFLAHGQQIKTTGNKHAHLILRGGAGGPNYKFERLQRAVIYLKENKVENLSILVDVSHDNSANLETAKKNPLLQPEIMVDVVESMKKDKELFNVIKGFMIESFNKTGKQDLKSKDLDLSGLSVTDPCIGIEETKEVIDKLYDEL